jgi:hypothetical protein
MSCPVLAVSIERRPTLEQAEAAAPLAASPTKLPRSAPPSAAGSPAGAAVAAGAAAAVAGQAAAPASEAAAASTAAAAQQAQRWISMESTPGSRMGSLHWGQVFYIPASLSPADCQVGGMAASLPQALQPGPCTASAARMCRMLKRTALRAHLHYCFGAPHPPDVLHP